VCRAFDCFLNYLQRGPSRHASDIIEHLWPCLACIIYSISEWLPAVDQPFFSQKKLRTLFLRQTLSQAEKAREQRIT